jgi:hypothetical protein
MKRADKLMIKENKPTRKADKEKFVVRLLRCDVGT